MSEIIKTEPSYSIDIFVAGEISDARRICRGHCYRNPLCVTLTSTEFIYTGGLESGVRVGLVNYPRFPSAPDHIWNAAQALATDLMINLSQWSVLIVGPDRTLWITRRQDGVGANG